MSVTALIARDSRLRKLNRLLEKGRFAFDCNQAIKEIQQLHTGRLGRNISVSDVIHKFQSKVLESILSAQANRTRIVEIKMQAFKVHAKLDEHTILVKKHLRSSYTQQLTRIVGTAVDRDSTLDTLLELPLKHLKQLKTTMDIADLAINDLDQQGWSNKAVISVMEAVTERKTAKF